jgi:hypothetical protein
MLAGSVLSDVRDRRVRDRVLVLGTGAGFWALFAGLLASLVAERDELFAHWQEDQLAIS